jgi:hypothetical protein
MHGSTDSPDASSRTTHNFRQHNSRRHAQSQRHAVASVRRRDGAICWQSGSYSDSQSLLAKTQVGRPVDLTLGEKLVNHLFEMSNLQHSRVLSE